MKKKVIIDGYEWFDMVEDCNNFSRLMDKLKPSAIKFEEYGTMKPKSNHQAI